MTKKTTTKYYECQSCGYHTIKYLGKCPSCKDWNSFVEVKEEKKKSKESFKIGFESAKDEIISIQDIEIENIDRFPTNDNELDLVLGGGAVVGSLILIGGSPGIGKSTLLLKVAGNIAKMGNVLYVSGEESLTQIKIRADRLNINEAKLFLYSEIEFEKIAEKIKNGFNNEPFKALIIDSIQTVYSNELSSTPGSITQVRTVTFELMRLAKNNGITIFIIGHITKDGAIAGPRVLEHMVDVVLYFEGELNSQLRILRSFKNRFGNTNEIGLFEMQNDGLVSAKNIASKFFSRSEPQSGSALTVVMEGTRPLIVEVQALVSETTNPNPKRSVNGFDYNRLNMLLALLEKKLDIPLNHYDVFINITGGIKISEAGSDLAILAAIISSFKNRPLSKKVIFIGEVSLIGDIRDVGNMEIRLKEALSQKIEKAIISKSNIKQEEMQLFFIDEVSRLLDWI